MTNVRLEAVLREAHAIEGDIRRHLLTATGIEAVAGKAAYRVAVALRKSVEGWIQARARGPQG